MNVTQEMSEQWKIYMIENQAIQQGRFPLTFEVKGPLWYSWNYYKKRLHGAQVYHY